MVDPPDKDAGQDHCCAEVDTAGHLWATPIIAPLSALAIALGHIGRSELDGASVLNCFFDRRTATTTMRTSTSHAKIPMIRTNHDLDRL